MCTLHLQRLRHENLINLIEVFRKRRKLYLVFEYVDHTVLEELEDHPKGLPPDTARSHVFQVLRGIEFCHQNNVRIIQLFSDQIKKPKNFFNDMQPFNILSLIFGYQMISHTSSSS